MTGEQKFKGARILVQQSWWMSRQFIINGKLVEMKWFINTAFFFLSFWAKHQCYKADDRPVQYLPNALNFVIIFFSPNLLNTDQQNVKLITESKEIRPWSHSAVGFHRFHGTFNQLRRIYINAQINLEKLAGTRWIHVALHHRSIPNCTFNCLFNAI